MTEQTQPTDAELEACPFCGNANAIVYDDLLTFHAGCLSCGSTGSVSSYRNGAIAAWNRRAVLAKWGTPAGAGEPVQCTCAAKDMPTGTCCKVRTAFEKWYDEQNNGRLQPFDVFKGGWVSLHRMIPTPQPTQAQAGADAVVEEVANGLRRYGLTLVKTASGYDVLSLREVAAHSIKGADHG